MFKAPFSFEGRIRRTEFGLSMIIYGLALTVVQMIVVTMATGSASTYSSSNNSSGFVLLFLILMIPLFIFLWAQGAKRCHDIGNSGWFQLIPFYGLWMLFQEGDKGTNLYGDDPKNSAINPLTSYQPQQTQTQTSTGNGYQGGYSGGHNNPDNRLNSTPAQSNSGEYKSGDLYR